MVFFIDVAVNKLVVFGS